MKIFKKISALDWKNPRPFFVLVRHFFHRLFQNDFVAFEDQMKEKTISLLAIIAVLSAHVANSVLMKYMFVADDNLSWVEKCYFTAFIMLLLGFITVIEWDVIFPDSRDFSNLITLPIRLRTIFTAKFTSLCLFVGLFALGANVLSVFPFWFHLPKWQAEGDFLFYLYFICVHLVCLLAASYFIFFFVVLLIGVLMVVLTEKLFRALSLFVRTVLMISFIFLMVYIVSGSFSGSQPYPFLTALKDNNSSLLYAFPPMWFTGLYESLLGSSDPQFRMCSTIALVSLVFVTFGFFVCVALGYRKYCKKAEIKKRVNLKLIRMKHVLSRAFDVVVLRHPIQRGVFYFFGKTLRRSLVHKMRLAIFLAAGFAFGLILLASEVRNPVAFSPLDKTLLSIPMILTFFLLVGMRRVVNIPASLEANWVFRLTEEQSLQHYAAGLRKGIVFYFLLPLFVLVFVFYVILWGWEMGFLHSVFGFVTSVMLMECLYLKYRKIPFACAYLPGQAKVHILWPVYVLSFLGYVLLSAVLERVLLKNPSLFFYFLGASVGVVAAVRIYQSFFLYRKSVLVYEEEPEPVLVTLLEYRS
jgi:hypothetical protein